MMKNKTKEGGSKMKKATKVLSIFVFTSLLLITHNSFAATSRFTPGSDNISPATTTSYNFPQGDGTTQMVAPGNMPGNTIWTSTTTTDGVDRALTQTGNGIQVDGPVPLELQKLLNNPATSRITAEINGQPIQTFPANPPVQYQSVQDLRAALEGIDDESEIDAIVEKFLETCPEYYDPTELTALLHDSYSDED